MLELRANRHRRQAGVAGRALGGCRKASACQPTGIDASGGGNIGCHHNQLRTMFVYKSRFLTRGEVWFDESPDSAPVDWIYHRQRSSPLPNHLSKCFYTLVIDLRKSPAELLAEMEGRTAGRIKEAQEKEKLWCE